MTEASLESRPLLAVDTAFERCSAAVYDPRTLTMLASAEPVLGKGHAERLMGIVAAVLADAGIGYADLGRLGVTVGPGSFTGLRVGVAAVRGLSLALGIPAVGISTLEAIAASSRGELRSGDAVLSVLDARRGELYAALYAAEGTERMAPRALVPDALADSVSASFGGGTEAVARLVIAGSGAAIAAEALSARSAFPLEIRILSNETRIDMAALCRLVAARPAGAAPVPLYLRGADAKPPSRVPGLSFVASDDRSCAAF